MIVPGGASAIIDLYAFRIVLSENQSPLNVTSVQQYKRGGSYLGRFSEIHKSFYGFNKK